MFLLMVDMKSLQALFGGTFDPVHYGHLKPVEILANLIGLSRVIIMPNNVPPHRAQPEASGEQRKRMVELAIADKPLFSLDERELKRDTASYTAQTLKEWREEQGECAVSVYHWSGFAADLPFLARLPHDSG